MLLCCFYVYIYVCFFFFKQKTAYEMRISDWSSDVCSSDLHALQVVEHVVGPDVGEDLADAGKEDDVEGAVLHLGPQCRGEVELRVEHGLQHFPKIGRASCRERVCQYV